MPPPPGESGGTRTAGSTVTIADLRRPEKNHRKSTGKRVLLSYAVLSGSEELSRSRAGRACRGRKHAMPPPRGPCGRTHLSETRFLPSSPWLSAAKFSLAGVLRGAAARREKGLTPSPAQPSRGGVSHRLRGSRGAAAAGGSPPPWSAYYYLPLKRLKPWASVYHTSTDRLGVKGWGWASYGGVAAARQPRVRRRCAAQPSRGPPWRRAGAKATKTAGGVGPGRAVSAERVAGAPGGGARTGCN